MLDWITGGLLPYVIAAVGAVAAIVAAYLKGRKGGAARADLRAAQRNIKTRDRMDEEDYVDDQSDDAAIRERMHERGKR